jgi:glycosyltransferase involved in cell wall biosynthesis
VTGGLLARLARRHDVAVLCLAEPGEPPLEAELVRVCARFEAVPRRSAGGLRARVGPKVALLRAVPTWASELAEPAFARAAARMAGEWRPDLVQVEYPVMGQYLDALDSCPAPRVLVDHDASIRDLREWRGPFARLTRALDERAWRIFERRVLERVQAAVVFTGRDRRALAALGTSTPVVEIPFGTPIPEAPLDAVGGSPPGILFVGNFRHPANTDGALWLARTLFPPLRAAPPEPRLTIVGPAPPAELGALASNGIHVVGEVPDVAPYLRDAAVVAVPIRVGGGMRVKVLEALAAGKAVVATPLAVEGLDLVPGEQLEVAAGEEEFRRALAGLLTDEQARRELGARARAWAVDRLGWDAPVARYEELYEWLVAAESPARARTRLLELALPRGSASLALVLGSGWPGGIQPPAAAAGAEPADLIVVAPTAAEAEEPGWLERAVDTCAERLAPDGAVHLLVSRRRRSRARGLLLGRGLAVESEVLHLPDVAQSRHLVPLEAAPGRHAFASVVPLVPWKRAVTSAVLGLRGGRLIAAAAADVALVARRPGAEPLFAWLALPGVPDGRRRSVVMTASWRPGGASVVLHPFAAGASPPVVVKLSLGRGADAAAEAARLARLLPAARQAGAAVPVPLDSTELDGAAVLIETRLAGQIAAPLLARRPARLDATLRSVCGWLEAWQRLTLTPTRLGAALLEREVLAPARALAPSLEGGEDYLAALGNLCSVLEGRPVRLAAAHNDLTMWNVLLDRRGQLGIVDWEAAEEATLPLKDLFYAVTDAVAATRRYADRPGAVRECFSPGGRHASMTAGLQAAGAAAADASPELVELSFHACWLGHAANERRTAGPFDPTPFRDIVQWLVDTGRP